MKNVLIVLVCFIILVSFIVYLQSGKTDFIVYEGCNYTGKKFYAKLDTEYNIRDIGFNDIRSAKAPKDVFFSPFGLFGIKHKMGGTKCWNYSNADDKPWGVVFSKSWLKDKDLQFFSN